MESLPSRFRRPGILTFMAYMLALAFFIVAIDGAKVSLPALFTGLPELGRILGEMFPPSLDRIGAIGLSRGLIALFRTVPDLVWALFFVIAVGLGPFAGTLAIMIDTIGFCGCFFAEAMEEQDKGPQEALHALGASRHGAGRVQTRSGSG